MDWVIFKADTKEVIGCVEKEDGGMTPVQTVGTYQKRTPGLIVAKLILDGVQIQTTGKEFGDLTWNLVDILRRHYEDQVRCSPCQGTGLFATATWDDPEVPCDYCQGTGENNPESEEGKS